MRPLGGTHQCWGVVATLLVVVLLHLPTQVEGGEAWVLAEDFEFNERRDLAQSMGTPGRTGLETLLSDGNSQVRHLAPEREAVMRAAAEGSATVEIRRAKETGGSGQGTTMEIVEFEVSTQCTDELRKEAASVLRLIEALSFNGIEAKTCADVGKISTDGDSVDLTLYLAYVLCTVAEVAKGVVEGCELEESKLLRRNLQGGTQSTSFRAQIGVLLMDLIDVLGRVFIRIPSSEIPDVSCPNIPRYCVTNVGLTTSPGGSFLPECTEECVRYLESLLSSTSGVTGDIGFLITVLQATETVAAVVLAPVTAIVDRLLGTFEAACAPCEINALLCETCVESAPELGCTVNVDFLPDTPEPDGPTSGGFEGIGRPLMPEDVALYRCNGESDCKFVNCEEVSSRNFECVNSLEGSPLERDCTPCGPLIRGGRRISGSGSGLGGV